MIKPNIYTQIYRIDLVVFRFVHFDLECSMFLAGKQSWIQFIKEVTIKTYVLHKNPDGLVILWWMEVSWGVEGGCLKGWQI